MTGDQPEPPKVELVWGEHDLRDAETNVEPGVVQFEPPPPLVLPPRSIPEAERAVIARFRDRVLGGPGAARGCLATLGYMAIPLVLAVLIVAVGMLIDAAI